MNEETKRLIDEVQGIIDDAAAEKKDRNTEPDEIEIRQAAENFRDIMARNGVDYFLSGKYQPKGDPKPKSSYFAPRTERRHPESAGGSIVSHRDGYEELTGLAADFHC